MKYILTAINWIIATSAMVFAGFGALMVYESLTNWQGWAMFTIGCYAFFMGILFHEKLNG